MSTEIYVDNKKLVRFSFAPKRSTKFKTDSNMLLLCLSLLKCRVTSTT